MCELTGKLTNRRIGYKVLAYSGGKFYSTFTGQRIKVGKVPRPPRRCKRLNSYWNYDLDHETLRSCTFYHKNFVGKTGAFTNKVYADNLLMSLLHGITYINNTSIVLVKIVFGGTVHSGHYQNMPIIASDSIKSIKIIK